MVMLTSHPPVTAAGATSVVKTAAGTAFSAASARGGMRFMRVMKT